MPTESAAVSYAAVRTADSRTVLIGNVEQTSPLMNGAPQSIISALEYVQIQSLE